MILDLEIKNFSMVGTIPPGSSVVFSGWRIENEEKDLASGGRSRSGRIGPSPPYLARIQPPAEEGEVGGSG
jgi:hypothetical protein